MCMADNHLAGDIARKQIRVSDWDAAVTAFEAVIDDFNIRGQRDEIPHPGWCTKFKFCPECGAPLDGLSLRNPDWES
ncbi:MAG: hypothetical protein BroJett012_09100 [Betaproteobacteria bacterium]|nr:MAG: hypothetical protein BroJett012_09100 [Betaproteobacteria bacterium]